jgi:hypothetical protein
VDARLAGPDTVRAIRVERRQRALAAFLRAPDPVSVENYVRSLTHLDGDDTAHTISEQIA